MCSSKRFMVSGLTYRPLIHFEAFSMYVLEILGGIYGNMKNRKLTNEQHSLEIPKLKGMP